MLNCIQAAKYLNMSVWSLKNLRDAGRLPPHTMPTMHRFLWDESDLDLWNKAGRSMKEYRRMKSLLT
jgi:hypothetical protein